MAQATPAVDPNSIAPDTGRPMSKATFYRFCIGFIIFGVMWMMSGTIGSAVLLPQRFNELFPGQAEGVLGSMQAFGSIFALVSNLVFGALSDACRSRFGRRTPWIAIGGIFTGAAFWFTSVQTTVPGIVAGWSALQVGLNCMLAPAVAVLSDRIPLDRRGTISAFYGAGATCGQSVGTIIGSQFITNPVPGFLFGTISWLFTGIIVLLIWPREKSAKAETAGEPFSIVRLAKSFVPPTKNCRDFYMALVGRLLFIFGYMVISGYQLYILQRYIGLDDVTAGAVLSTMSVIIMIVSLVTSLISGVVSDKIGRRKPLIVASSAVICIAFIAPWVMRTAESMYIFAALSGFGYGIYSAVDQALNVDVLPSKEEAGKDMGIQNLANTVGQAIAPVVTSSIVVATGSYFMTFPVAIALILAGVIFIMLVKKVK